MSASTGSPAAVDGPLFVDAHVHLHPVFDLQLFFQGASRNVAAAAARTTHDARSASLGVLLFAEGAGEGAFARLRSAMSGGAGQWTIHETAEAESLQVRERGALRLVAIAGRQIVTAEKVEVLALLSAHGYRDGAALEDTLTAVKESGGVAVLPWGFGKWTMRRGALVASVVRSAGRGLFLGDNAGRLRAAPTPALLVEGRRLGIPILPGSDPLPFRDQQTRAGSFGSIATAKLDLVRPAEGLRAWYRELRGQPPQYGRLENLTSFCRNQLRMQLRKRLRRRDQL